MVRAHLLQIPYRGIQLIELVILIFRQSCEIRYQQLLSSDCRRIPLLSEQAKSLVMHLLALVKIH